MLQNYQHCPSYCMEPQANLSLMWACVTSLQRVQRPLFYRDTHMASLLVSVSCVSSVCESMATGAWMVYSGLPPPHPLPLKLYISKQIVQLVWSRFMRLGPKWKTNLNNLVSEEKEQGNCSMQSSVISASQTCLLWNSFIYVLECETSYLVIDSWLLVQTLFAGGLFIHLVLRPVFCVSFLEGGILYFWM